MMFNFHTGGHDNPNNYYGGSADRQFQPPIQEYRMSHLKSIIIRATEVGIVSFIVDTTKPLSTDTA